MVSLLSLVAIAFSYRLWWCAWSGFAPAPDGCADGVFPGDSVSRSGGTERGVLLVVLVAEKRSALDNAVLASGKSSARFSAYRRR